MADQLRRTMLQRRDARLVNAARKRGMLIVCAAGGCCGQATCGDASPGIELYLRPELRRLFASAAPTLTAAFHDLTPQRPYPDGGDGLWVFARREGGAA